MRASSTLPPEIGPIFSTADALRAGVSPKRLRAGDLLSPFTGARVIPPALVPANSFEVAQRELVARCRAFSSVAPVEFCFSGMTAAALYGIPLSNRLQPDRPVDVSVPSGHTPPRRRDVRGHRLDHWQVRPFLGMPVIVPTLAWAQLVAQLTLDELVIAGDYLVRRKRPLATLEMLADATDAIRRGSRLARAALVDVRPGTDSPPETETRLALVRAGLPEPLIGHTVYHEGYFVGTPDLAYVAEKIAIEYQGSGHWLDRGVFEDDIIRRELFERAGWKAFLVTASRLRRPAQLAAEVAVLLRERAAPN